jgi:glycosyltransferase involved in cell wall biosynthesis
MPDPNHILLTNIRLHTRTGTEVVIRDLAKGLQSLGKQPMVYSPVLGEMAEEIAATGIPVVSRLVDLPTAPQIIHGHHHVETLEALESFAGAQGIFVCHDRTAWHDYPPVHPRLRRYVAVDFNCRERMVDEAFVSEESVRVITNAVDLSRFHPRVPLPKKPSRALVFSNYAEVGNWLDSVRKACAEESLALDVLGSGTNRSTRLPEELLGQYDLIFGKARCALESLATGCSVVVCDFRGLGGLVTTENMRAWREWNFGARLMTGSPTVENIRKEIHKYNPENAAQVSGFIRRTAGLEAALNAYLALYREIAQGSSADLNWTERLRRQLQARQQLRDSLERPMNHPMMPVLQASDVEKIGLQLAPTPQEVATAVRFHVQGELHNGAKHMLSSGGGNPVAFSYHWKQESENDLIAQENPRTILPAPLPPGCTLPFTVSVLSPERPGFYILEFTILQEHVMWFDGHAPQFPVSRKITVSDSSGV